MLSYTKSFTGRNRIFAVRRLQDMFLFIQAALLRVSSFNEIIRLLSVAKASLGESLSAFEYFDGQCVKCLQMNGFNDLLKNLPPGRRSEEQDYYALVEVSVS